MMTFSKNYFHSSGRRFVGRRSGRLQEKNEPIVEKKVRPNKPGKKLDQAASKAGEEINKAASAAGKKIQEAGEKNPGCGQGRAETLACAYRSCPAMRSRDASAAVHVSNSMSACAHRARCWRGHRNPRRASAAD
ncbi:hypothetical protein ACFS07_29045 [Undibacterium arcticum]